MKHKKNGYLMSMVMANRILLGLAMLIPGLTKLFIMKPSGVTGFLAGLGFPIAGFFAWILILAEIIFGIAILFNYKMKYTTIPPAIILLVASFMVHWGNWSSFLIHLLAASNYLLFGAHTGEE